MHQYYQINKENDLLGSYDLPELQMYILILKYLLRMGKKDGVAPEEDWGTTKKLLMRVKNHISFHTHGVKPSDITVDFYSPEVRKLFLAVFGNGSETYTSGWLDAFEAVKDEIDRQVDNERAMCQYAAASGKRCDNCQCPKQLRLEKGKDMSMNIQFRATVWQGNKKVTFELPNVEQTPTDNTYQIAESADPVLSYIKWHLERYQDWERISPFIDEVLKYKTLAGVITAHVI